MKNYIWILFFMFWILFLWYENIYASTDCSSYSENMSSIQIQIDDLNSQKNNMLDYIISTNPWITISRANALAIRKTNELVDQINILIGNYNTNLSSYKICDANNKLELTNLFDNWYNAYSRQDYESSIEYYKKYLNLNWNQSDENYKRALDNLKLWLIQLIVVNSSKKNWDNLIKYSNDLINYDNRNVKAYIGLSLWYLNKGDYKNSKINIQKAYDFNNDASLVKELESISKSIENEEQKAELLKNAPTNDPLSGYQYYLKELNITMAWKKVTNSNQAIVAIIDDWININHPDLTNSIWTNSNAKYGSSKIIDFVWDWLYDNAVAWEHWTNIAWIIWATQNNNEWIAGISNNVKLMPLRVFNTKWWATEDSIIKAMNYAIDNWANIINLSLWLSQFAYSTKFDSVIKKTYDKWIVVVIASWNWDIYSKQTNWVNLDNNPIAPICNNWWNKKYSIWVLASDKDWYRTNWTNYWNCAQFMAPWENIVTTNLSSYTNENPIAWSSFSAPIISWVIALGYNQYGYIPPVIVYDSLVESKVKNSVWNSIVDASKYLDILWQKVWNIKKEEAIKWLVDKVFNKIKTNYSKYSEVDRKEKYQKLYTQLSKYDWRFKDEKRAFILKYLKELVNSEL